MKFSELPFFRHVKWFPDRSELRQFAIAMLVGFAVLGALAVWRNHGFTRASIVLFGLGVVLAVAAMIPGLGRVAYLAVYVPSSFVGYFVSKVILFIVFFLVFVPIGALLKVLGKDLLRLRPEKPRAVWTSLNSTRDADRYYRQF
ncbi:MAG TPA: hypothetical protein VE135_27665 [Pyrinomonadaceae bacterium]|nr:hypothetical protein [Pyrinomonadaceae bacterium]